MACRCYLLIFQPHARAGSWKIFSEVSRGSVLTSENWNESQIWPHVGVPTQLLQVTNVVLYYPQVYNGWNIYYQNSSWLLSLKSCKKCTIWSSRHIELYNKSLISNFYGHSIKYTSGLLLQFQFVIKIYLIEKKI